jgi:hypothetical protein
MVAGRGRGGGGEVKLGKLQICVDLYTHTYRQKLFKDYEYYNCILKGTLVRGSFWLVLGLNI